MFQIVWQVSDQAAFVIRHFPLDSPLWRLVHERSWHHIYPSSGKASLLYLSERNALTGKVRISCDSISMSRKKAAASSGGTGLM
jgi:hypothetical protein